MSEGEQFNAASTVFYSNKITGEFRNQPDLMSHLIFDQTSMKSQVTSALRQILTQQGNKAKLVQMQHAQQLKSFADVKSALAHMEYWALRIWKDIYPVMRQVLNGYEQRYEALIAYAHRRGQTAAHHIPTPFTPVMFPFVVPHLMKMAGLTPLELPQEIKKMKAQLKYQERLILKNVKIQLNRINDPLQNWPPSMSSLKLITQSGEEDIKKPNRRSVRFSTLSDEDDSPIFPIKELEPIDENDEFLDSDSDEDKPLLAQETSLTKPKPILKAPEMGKPILKAPEMGKQDPVQQDVVLFDLTAIETQIVYKKREILTFYKESDTLFVPNAKYFVKIQTQFDEFFRVVNEICFTYTKQMYTNIVSYKNLPAFKWNAHP